MNPAAAAAPGKLQLELGVRWQLGPASEVRGTAADDVWVGEGVPDGRLPGGKIDRALKLHFTGKWLPRREKRPLIL